MIKFSILITTKDRLESLKFTLNKTKYLIEKKDVECIVCDDGSSDGTFQYLKNNYPDIILIQHQKSIGLIASRNELLNLTKAKYAITLDDDAYILSDNPLEEIESFFKCNPNCGVLAFRIFWGKEKPQTIECNLKPLRVKSYVGCGHVWNMQAWVTIPCYPDWFVFYGEEEFASYKLFKTNWEVWFFPSVLVHHMVDVKSRKKLKDYTIRLRRSLRSGWYLYFLFFPLAIIPRKLVYTLWAQVKTKLIKGDLKAFTAVLSAVFDLIFNLPKLLKKRDSLTKLQYKEYKELPDTIIYWQPLKYKNV